MPGSGAGQGPDRKGPYTSRTRNYGTPGPRQKLDPDSDVEDESDGDEIRPVKAKSKPPPPKQGKLSGKMVSGKKRKGPVSTPKSKGDGADVEKTAKPKPTGSNIKTPSPGTAQGRPGRQDPPAGSIQQLFNPVKGAGARPSDEKQVDTPGPSGVDRILEKARNPVSWDEFARLEDAYKSSVRQNEALVKTIQSMSEAQSAIVADKDRVNEATKRLCEVSSLAIVGAGLKASH